jgi:hypothetical protein
MRRPIISTVTSAILAGLIVLAPCHAGAADLGAGAAIDQPAVGLDLATALSRYHDLLAIRVSFDVLDAAELVPELEAAARRWSPAGPGAGEVAQLDNALLAEASYYLTSVAYVVEVGGAAFPDDGPYDSYRNDTLVAIAALRDRLIDAVTNGEPVNDILVEAQRLRWLTEGETSVPPASDRFAGHDELITRLTRSPDSVGI